MVLSLLTTFCGAQPRCSSRTPILTGEFSLFQASVSTVLREQTAGGSKVRITPGFLAALRSVVPLGMTRVPRSASQEARQLARLGKGRLAGRAEGETGVPRFRPQNPPFLPAFPSRCGRPRGPASGRPCRPVTMGRCVTLGPRLRGLPGGLVIQSERGRGLIAREVAGALADQTSATRCSGRVAGCGRPEPCGSRRS